MTLIQGPEVVITPKGENLKWKSLAKKKGDNLFFFLAILQFFILERALACPIGAFLADDWVGQGKRNVKICGSGFMSSCHSFLLGTHRVASVTTSLTPPTHDIESWLFHLFSVVVDGDNGDIFTVSVFEWDISLKLIDWIKTHTNILLSKTSFRY